MSMGLCPVCGRELNFGCRSWHSTCKSCGYEKGHLQSRINEHSAHQVVDENAREIGLRELRQSNFSRLLQEIKGMKPDGGRLLDVGCAHGWFLEMAQNDFDVLGLEPDEKVFSRIRQSGFLVRNGYFPDALAANEKFDVIVFNDVLEHIRDINTVLTFCHSYLNEGGLLVINLPNSKGVIYRASRLICKLGYPALFERMWQKDFPSPHLHYFNNLNLARLLESSSFHPVANGRLSTLRLSGLYKRISYAGGYRLLKTLLLWFSAVMILPALRIFPADIMYVVAIKK